MPANEIAVIAWPIIGVISMGLFGWWMLGWIDRKHPRQTNTPAGKPAENHGATPLRGRPRIRQWRATPIETMPRVRPRSAADK
ncbi:hypothetical protein [Rhodopseudomonas palustris]|uniref:hypothetical protein n=1 Tax=Rhodopseudomonas palustris TaxID=1076 RepID=UPI0005A2D561